MAMPAVRTGRRITGMSAVLLPYDAGGEIDWAAFAAGVERTAVLYADGEKPAAQKVARDLGVDKATVEPVDRETRRLAGDADVVVIAGEDRAS